LICPPVFNFARKKSHPLMDDSFHAIAWFRIDLPAHSSAGQSFISIGEAPNSSLHSALLYNKKGGKAI
jgi:hypothetical protein